MRTARHTPTTRANLAPLHTPQDAALEALEVNDPHGHHLAAVHAVAERAGHLDLLRRLNECAERTASGRWRFLYRVSGAPTAARTVLAVDEDGAAFADAHTPARPSPVDQTGARWEPLTGSPATAPTLSAAERGRVHALFREVDHSPGPRTTASAPPASCLATDFNRRTSWADVLTPAGWTVHAQGAAGWAYWTRPAGFLRAPQTAVTGLDPTGERLCAYGARTAPFEPWAHYDRFTAYAVLHHGGDMRAASAALAAQGYGPPPAFAAA